VVTDKNFASYCWWGVQAKRYQGEKKVLVKEVKKLQKLVAPTAPDAPAANPAADI
jgi:hypothetical protein